MKFKDIINGTAYNEQYPITNWIFLFSIVYFCAYIGLFIICNLIFKTLEGLSTGIAMGAALVSTQVVLERFVKKYKRIPNLGEYKRFLWGSFGVAFIIHTLIAAFILWGTIPGHPLKPGDMSISEFLFVGGMGILLSGLALFFIQFLTLRGLIKTAAKKLQKAKQPPGTLSV
jgi:hypothetical protein